MHDSADPTDDSIPLAKDVIEQRKLISQGTILDSVDDVGEDEVDETGQGIGVHINITDPDFDALATLRKATWMEPACVKATVNQVYNGARALALADTRFANGVVKITMNTLSRTLLGAATVLTQLTTMSCEVDWVEKAADHNFGRLE